MSSFVLDKCLGAIETVHPLSIPPGYMRSIENMDLSATEFARPRAGTSELSLTSGPGAEVTYLFADNLNSRLWAFVAATGTAYYWNGTVWASTALSDYTSSATPHCVAYNGKVFMAYDGSVNRLHVYDAAATSPAVRRVGLDRPAAPTAANGGGGGVAVIRYYRVQMVIHRDPADSSTPIHASSEVSPSVSFTPGANGVLITKPATVDSATHWRIYGSTDNVTFYRITGDIAVGTATYTDNVTPSNYGSPDYVVPPEVGLYIPPPSAKFLATNGERLFMAGAYETTATSSQTTPTPRRVWYTRPLGVTDDGDDEAITQTTDSRYYLDIDNDDGGAITGLASTLDGSVYAFTATSVWRLADTGDTNTPVRADRVVSGIGAMSQYLITESDGQNASAVYFMAKDGPYRYSPNEGAVWLGADWVDLDAPNTFSDPSSFACAGFDPVYRRVVFAAGGRGFTRACTPDFVTPVGGLMRGGWTYLNFRWQTPSAVKSVAVFGGRLYYGGSYFNIVATPIIAYHDDASTEDITGAFDCTIQTGELVGDETRLMTVNEPYVHKATGNGCAGTVALASILHGETTSDTFTAGQTGRFKVEGLTMADTPSVNVTVTMTTLATRSTSRADAIPRMILPYKVQEPA